MSTGRTARQQRSRAGSRRGCEPRGRLARRALRPSARETARANFTMVRSGRAGATMAKRDCDPCDHSYGQQCDHHLAQSPKRLMASTSLHPSTRSARPSSCSRSVTGPGTIGKEPQLSSAVRVSPRILVSHSSTSCTSASPWTDHQVMGVIPLRRRVARRKRGTWSATAPTSSPLESPVNAAGVGWSGLRAARAGPGRRRVPARPAS